jgi:hypothetical protein
MCGGDAPDRRHHVLEVPNLRRKVFLALGRQRVIPRPAFVLRLPPFGLYLVINESLL